MRQVKEVFDPDNRMNPGARSSTRRLQLRISASAKSTKPFNCKPSSTGAAITATKARSRCATAPASARKLGAGTMCPSYIATRDEKDTTRGRANALRNAMAGRIPREELFSPQMYEVMDLCIGCKACKSECPSAVDMARIKAEYLVHYYDRNGLPLFNRLMGTLAHTEPPPVPIRRPLIPLVNWGLKAAPVKAALARAGVDSRRNLPAYTRQPLSDWFARRSPAQRARVANGPAPATVILFPRYLGRVQPSGDRPGRNTGAEAAGYEVRLAEGRASADGR